MSRKTERCRDDGWTADVGYYPCPDCGYLLALPLDREIRCPQCGNYTIRLRLGKLNEAVMEELRAKSRVISRLNLDSRYVRKPRRAKSRAVSP